MKQVSKVRQEAQGHQVFLAMWDREAIQALQAHKGKPAPLVRWADAVLPEKKATLAGAFRKAGLADKY